MSGDDTDKKAPDEAHVYGGKQMPAEYDLDTRDGFERALMDLGAVLPCPACGSTEYQIWDERKSREFQYLVESSVALEAKHVGRFMPVLARVCINCTNVQTFAKLVLMERLKFLEAQKAENKDE